MATRILGPTGSKRRRRFLLAPILMVAAAALYLTVGAQAVHDTGKFQLDGDASSSTQPGTAPAATDDWDKVCHQYANPLPTGGCGTSSDTAGSTSGSWASDGSLNSTIFTGGGSKDPQDISAWNWKDGAGGLPDKDNLIHAFAVRYSLPPDRVDTVPPGAGDLGNGTACPAGTFPTCEVIYFGIDRFDNSGDAQNGFWFLKSNVQTVTGKTNTFSGVHQNGDVLVVSDFSNGGTTSIITVYEWDATCTAANKPDSSCADSNLRTLASSTDANCASSAAGDQFCGIVNPNNTTAVPWSGDYTDKSGNSTHYLQGEFYEAGLNLSTLGLAGECFSSMVAESRSSTSTTATLKDFVVAHFPQCKPQLTTQASLSGQTITPGTPVHDTATVTVTGGSPTTTPDPTGTVTFFLCGPSASANPTCTSDGNAFTGNTGLLGDSNRDGVVDDTTPNDGIAAAVSGNVNTSTSKLAPGFYCFRATWPGDSNYPPPPSGTFTNPDNTGECFRVQDTSSMTTAQNWLPNDSATITSANGTALNGTVDFVLYDGTINCSTPGTATVLYTEPTITVTNATSPDTEHTNNTDTKITVANSRTVTWRVVFTSTDGGVASPAAPTCETTTMTITN
jgi:hypothetical protein